MKQHFFRLHLSLVRTVIFTLCALSASTSALAEKFQGVPLDGNFKPAERAVSMLKVVNANSTGLSDIKRVAISSFQVQFVTAGAASASSYEIGKPGKANVNSMIKLVGLEKSDFQAITDQLHTQFIQDLSAMNIDVVPTEQILAAQAYKKMADSGKPSPAETRTSDTWSAVYAPAGLAVYGVGSSSAAVTMFAGFTAMSDVMSTLSGNADLSKELDAKLIVVRLVVNFVDTKSSDSSWFGRSSGQATIAWKFGPSVAAGESSMIITSPTSTATMTLQAPLLMDGSAFKEIKDTTSVAGNVGLALLSLAIGGGNSASAVSKDAIADPEKYRSYVGAGVGAVREMFMERLRAGK
jgi:hypothetical protein